MSEAYNTAASRGSVLDEARDYLGLEDPENWVEPTDFQDALIYKLLVACESYRAALVTLNPDGSIPREIAEAVINGDM